MTLSFFTMREIRRHVFFHRVGRTPSADLRHDGLGRTGGRYPPYADAWGATEALIPICRRTLV